MVGVVVDVIVLENAIDAVLVVLRSDIRKERNANRAGGRDGLVLKVVPGCEDQNDIRFGRGLNGLVLALRGPSRRQQTS